jgi:transcriptional regulator with XRE-family HTH domain
MTLKELRLDKGLSQSQLAEAAEISIRTLQQYEQGARDINGCRLKTLIKLSNVLECDIIEILTDDELIEMIKNKDTFL